TDATVRAIEGIQGVHRLERRGSRMELHVNEAEIAVPDLLLEVQRLGGRVRMFQPDALDMETAFLRLTRGKTS
ncbi:MAG: multidrug ABC transporter ATP-binding protein, partial [Planctomycetes bacterium]|nr:multidrug ABC transporter ATP-binding protein [Planctomycetota bacterium]